MTLGAVQRGGEVQVQVSDDGRGLNERGDPREGRRTRPDERCRRRASQAARIYRFIFAPGFSTAAKVTETSGRGVGMDVVLNTVQQLGGDIDVETKRAAARPSRSACRCRPRCRRRCSSASTARPSASPSASSPRCSRCRPRRCSKPADKRRSGTRAWHCQSTGWPTCCGRARRLRPPLDFRSIVIISNGRETIGLEVDRVRRRQELFLKDLHPLLAACPTVSGAAVLGDGRIVLLLDADELIQLVRNGKWRGAPEAATEAGDRDLHLRVTAGGTSCCWRAPRYGAYRRPAERRPGPTGTCRFSISR